MVTALALAAGPSHAEVMGQSNAGFVVKLSANTTGLAAATWQMLIAPAE